MLFPNQVGISTKLLGRLTNTIVNKHEKVELRREVAENTRKMEEMRSMLIELLSHFVPGYRSPQEEPHRGNTRPTAGVCQPPFTSVFSTSAAASIPSPNVGASAIHQIANNQVAAFRLFRKMLLSAAHRVP
jgi:hypothetical protein